MYHLAWEIGFRRGQLKAARKVLRILGDWELGPPDARIASIIERLDDLEQLESMILRIRTARNWQGLLGPLLPGSRKETGAAALTQRPKMRPGQKESDPCSDQDEPEGPAGACRVPPIQATHG
jgi:hypothetical protein